MDSPGVRLSRACQGCRIAKVRCCPSEIQGDPICMRCREAGLQCNRVPTRRGRVKGSKNRKTLERLHTMRQSQDSILQSGRRISTTDMSPGEASSTTEAGTCERERTNRSLSPLDLIWTRPQSISPSNVPQQPVPLPPITMSNQHPQSTNVSSNIASSSRRPGLDQLQQSFPTSRSSQISLPTHHSDPSAVEGELQNPLLWLAECARQGWDSRHVSGPLGFPSPVSVLPSEDIRLWNQWGHNELFRALHDQQTFFQHGLYGTKRDVSEGLDAVQKGIIAEEEVAELFDSYYRYCHFQRPILDSTLHTSTYVRSRSAYLFTVILMNGAIAVATLPNSTPRQCHRANQLHAHAEKLQSVLCATAAKSIEIVQAEMLFIEWCLRKDRLVDDQRWPRMGWASRLTASIGLRHAGSRTAEELDNDPLAKNDFRLRVSLILFESRWEAIADRKSVSSDISELSSAELDKLKRLGPFDSEAMLAADYALYQFEVDSKERLSRIPPGDSIGFEAEKVWISTFLTLWEEKWLSPHSDSLTRWHYRYVSLRSRLVGLLRITKAQLTSGNWISSIRNDLLALAIQMLEGALCHERALHMIGRTSALIFAATIVLQLTEPDASSRDLILRVALRLAGDPNQDLMTYEKHNGFQLINMLCLSSIARKKRLGTAINAPKIDQSYYPIDVSKISAMPPQPGISETYSTPRTDYSTSATATATNTNTNTARESDTGPTNSFAWADIDQVFGNFREFPYFPTSTSLGIGANVGISNGLGGMPAGSDTGGENSSHIEGIGGIPGGGDQGFGFPVFDTDPSMGGFMEYLASRI
ncbi:uncharacterized protein L201_003283 [Kwoniella dendrophila CBS 6074]|uniref:Zn(2)-C6 fungal-type domain-containing protein n=1 Tax=Kwoniella dendrophila CBS 6074 TaxID=1295534 RepID=A0AAX4JSF4_9TREE